MGVVVKPLPVFLVLSLLCMAMGLPGAHSGRLMQSERDNFHGGSGDFSSFEKENLEADARYSNCWQLEPTSVPTSPTLSDYVFLQCWTLALAPGPAPMMASAPINDEKENPKDGAIYLQCWSLTPAPAPAPTSLTPINDKKEIEKPKDDALSLQCWLLATKPTTNINVDKRDNPKLLFFCGYPCCGFKIHSRCNRCCPKGVLHPPSPTTHVKEVGKRGGDGHGRGD